VNRTLGILALVLTLFCTAAATAQDDENPVVWSLDAPAKQLKAGEKFTATVVVVLAGGWHVYSLTQPPGGPTTTVISLPAGQPFALAGKIRAPKPERVMDPNFNMETELYSDSVTFSLPLAVAAKAPPGPRELRVDVLFQACNDRSCLPPTTISLKTSVKLAAAAAITAEGGRGTPAAFAPITAEGGRATPPKVVNTNVVSNQSLAAFIWLAAVMGALSLLTPCVFPMIPITVSYFTSHAAASRTGAIRQALIYALGIILTFTALGMALAILVGAGGINQFAANPWVNLLITAIFLAFALNLFGAYFIQVPAGLMNRLDSLTRSHTGTLGTLLMGFTFTLTSFTCTAAFIGTLLVMAAQGSWRWPLLGMLGFSTVFAIPFFVLAVAPQWLSQMPKSGGWLNAIKVVMGFLEIAAAMKFLSNADLVWQWGIFTREVCLAVWVAVGVLIIVYLLGWYRFPHDTPLGRLGAIRAACAVFFLALTLWLTTGLFGRPLGELESFLPPPTTHGDTAVKAKEGQLEWILNDYDAALAQARRQGKRVFVDFTGYTCTNCRWMEANMFTRPEISRALAGFVRVRLYTDGAGERFQRQQKMQQEKFGTVALPYYVILDAAGNPLATFGGLTRKPEEFLNFLSKS
jgi:thiol:disulfide interchange protein DsbD